MENITSKKGLILFGKIIRILCKCVPVRLMFAVQMKKRHLGRPNITVRYSFISYVEQIISHIDPAGSFNSWARVVFDETRWIELVNILESKQADWDDSDWTHTEIEANLDWNKSPPSSFPSSRSSSNSSPILSFPFPNNDISNYFETL